MGVADVPGDVGRFVSVRKLVTSYWKWKRPVNDSRDVWELHVCGTCDDGRSFEIWARASRFAWSINLRTEDGYAYRLESDRRSRDRLSGQWIDGPHCNIEAPNRPKQAIARPELAQARVDRGMAIFCKNLNIELKWPYHSPNTQQRLRPWAGGDDHESG